MCKFYRIYCKNNLCAYMSCKPYKVYGFIICTLFGSRGSHRESIRLRFGGLLLCAIKIYELPDSVSLMPVYASSTSRKEQKPFFIYETWFRNVKVSLSATSILSYWVIRHYLISCWNYLLGNGILVVFATQQKYDTNPFVSATQQNIQKTAIFVMSGNKKQSLGPDPLTLCLVMANPNTGINIKHSNGSTKISKPFSFNVVDIRDFKISSL